jgi:hypothetical protein
MTLSVVIPYFGEDTGALEQTLRSLRTYGESSTSQAQVILVDGAGAGCSAEGVLVIPNPYPPPNKDGGIVTAMYEARGNDILIVDADIALDVSAIETLHRPLERAKMVVPDLERVGGRSNRLLGAPLLRVFFPEVYGNVRYPFPGMVAFKRELLESVVADDFFHDWGGEIQLVVEGHLRSQGAVESPPMRKRDPKRKLISMMTDAYQIYRAGLYLASKHCRYADDLLERDLQTHPGDVAALSRFIIESGSSFSTDPREESDRLGGMDGQEAARYLLGEHERTGRYEFYLLASMVAKPLFEMLTQEIVDIDIIEHADVKCLRLRDCSLYADIILCSVAARTSVDLRGRPFAFYDDLLGDRESSGGRASS